MGIAGHLPVMTNWEDYEEKMISKTGSILELEGYFRIRSLGDGSRLLRSFLCRSDRGRPVVLKIFPKGEAKEQPKRGATLFDPKEQLRELDHLSKLLRNEPCLCPMIPVGNSPNAIYLTRQFFRRSLYDRILSLPRLIPEEKLFFSFQILRAVDRLHGLGAFHGDISCENIMVTSWGWVVICDFASHKPFTLNANDPAEYDSWFLTKERNRCYIAPERFRSRRKDRGKRTSSAHTGTSSRAQQMIKRQMADIFSVGCVLAEGRYNPGKKLERVANIRVQSMIRQMLNSVPGQRGSAKSHLQQECGKLFPRSFQFLFALMSGLLLPGLGDGDARLLYFAAQSRTILKELAIGDDVATTSLGESLGLLESTIAYITGLDLSSGAVADLPSRRMRLLSKLPSTIPEGKKGGGREAASAIGIIATVVFATLPLTVWPKSRCVGLRLLMALSPHLPANLIVEVGLPVLITLTKDADPSVRCAAIRATTRLLEALRFLSKRSSSSSSSSLGSPRLFTDYVFPEMAKKLQDCEEGEEEGRLRGGVGAEGNDVKKITI
eukprot:jgi/Bigna1/67501/fgenesh1_pg.3_\